MLRGFQLLMTAPAFLSRAAQLEAPKSDDARISSDSELIVMNDPIQPSTSVSVAASAKQDHSNSYALLYGDELGSGSIDELIFLHSAYPDLEAADSKLRSYLDSYFIDGPNDITDEELLDVASLYKDDSSQALVIYSDLSKGLGKNKASIKQELKEKISADNPVARYCYCSQLTQGISDTSGSDVHDKYELLYHLQSVSKHFEESGNKYFDLRIKSSAVEYAYIIRQKFPLRAYFITRDFLDFYESHETGGAFFQSLDDTSQQWVQVARDLKGQLATAIKGVYKTSDYQWVMNLPYIQDTFQGRAYEDLLLDEQFYESVYDFSEKLIRDNFHGQALFIYHLLSFSSGALVKSSERMFQLAYMNPGVFQGHDVPLTLADHEYECASHFFTPFIGMTYQSEGKYDVAMFYYSLYENFPEEGVFDDEFVYFVDSRVNCQKILIYADSSQPQHYSEEKVLASMQRVISFESALDTIKDPTVHKMLSTDISSTKELLSDFSKKRDLDSASSPVYLVDTSRQSADQQNDFNDFMFTLEFFVCVGLFTLSALILFRLSLWALGSSSSSQEEAPSTAVVAKAIRTKKKPDNKYKRWTKRITKLKDVKDQLEQRKLALIQKEAEDRRYQLEKIQRMKEHQLALANRRKAELARLKNEEKQRVIRAAIESNKANAFLLHSLQTQVPLVFRQRFVAMCKTKPSMQEQDGLMSRIAQILHKRAQGHNLIKDEQDELGRAQVMNVAFRAKVNTLNVRFIDSKVVCFQITDQGVKVVSGLKQTMALNATLKAEYEKQLEAKTASFALQTKSDLSDDVSEADAVIDSDDDADIDYTHKAPARVAVSMNETLQYVLPILELFHDTASAADRYSFNDLFAEVLPDDINAENMAVFTTLAEGAYPDFMLEDSQDSGYDISTCFSPQALASELSKSFLQALFHSNCFLSRDDFFLASHYLVRLREITALSEVEFIELLSPFQQKAQQLSTKAVAAYEAQRLQEQASQTATAAASDTAAAYDEPDLSHCFEYASEDKFKAHVRTLSLSMARNEQEGKVLVAAAEKTLRKGFEKGD